MSGRAIPRIKKSIKEDSWVEDAIEILGVIKPKWIEERDNNGVEIKSKIFTDGLSNKLFGFHLVTRPSDMVLFRVYRASTELWIDRQAEIDTMTLLHEKNCGPELYAVFENGISYEYIHGEILTLETCRSPNVFPIVATEMARVHSTIPLSFPPGESHVGSFLWSKMNEAIELNEGIVKTNTVLASRLLHDFGFSQEQAKKDLEELEGILEKEDIPIVFSHNDILLANVTYNKEEATVSFIDFEWAFPNYVAFDVANHFNEFAGIHNPDFALCPDTSFKRQWIAEYLKHFEMKKGAFTLEQFEKWVELCIPASHLFWALWAVVQAHHAIADFDFAEYFGLRYTEYKKSMVEIRGKISSTS